MNTRHGNVFADSAGSRDTEQFAALLAAPDLRLERIVSLGQATPPGVWLDQNEAEWAILLRGAAKLSFEGENGARDLKPGDYMNIPAHCRHRVEWTTPDEPTIWLALHYAA
jgi:cupin 2 domain-containing protein